MIVVTVEGGRVQGVSSDDPKLVGLDVVVIDYGVEEANSAEIEKVPQGKGEFADAVVSTQQIGVLYKPVARFLKKRAK